MKKLSIIFILFLVALVSTFFLWWRQGTKAISSSGKNIRFVIPKGYSASRIGNKLQEEGLIRSSLIFKIYVQVASKSGKIQAGEYTLSPSKNFYQIVTELLKGPSEIWITIPEGLRREEVAVKVANGLDKTGAEFGDFVKAFNEASKDFEGYLFPDTYLVPKDIQPGKVVDVMRTNFSRRTKNFFSNRLSFDQSIILASIIERETKSKDEKGIVSGILLKRFEEGWPLQVDATLQYAVVSAKCKEAVCKFWEPAMVKDKEINSPYNTYKYRGFPPAPISNPGLDSIKAAFDPQTSDYWYYLHDPKGVIHYAKTLEEHNGNIQKYLVDRE